MGLSKFFFIDIRFLFLILFPDEPENDVSQARYVTNHGMLKSRYVKTRTDRE